MHTVVVPDMPLQGTPAACGAADPRPLAPLKIPCPSGRVKLTHSCAGPRLTSAQPDYGTRPQCTGRKWHELVKEYSTKGPKTQSVASRLENALPAQRMSSGRSRRRSGPNLHQRIGGELHVVTRQLRRLVAVLALVALVIGGCGGSGTSSQSPASGGSTSTEGKTLEELAKQEGKVVVFSPSKGSLMTDLGEAFTAKYGIEFENIYLGSTQIMNRLRAEKDNPTGDVWIGAGGIIPFLVAKEEGLLEPYQITGYEVPEKNGEIVMRDSEHYFNGAWILTLGWAYNTQKGSPADMPQDFSEFFKPEWKDQVEMADPAASGTAVLFLMSHILKYLDEGKTEDEAWADLAKFADQVKRFPESGGGPSADVAKGDIKLGQAFDQQTYLLKSQGEPVDWVLPKNTPTIIDPAGLIKGAPHPNAGKLFLEFVLSKEGQEMIAKDGPYMPVRPDVQPADVFTYTLDDYAKNAQKLDLNWLKTNYDAVQQRWRTEIAGQ